MAHNLMENEHGESAYIGRQSAWHSLGHVSGKFMTWNEMLKANHGILNYEVAKVELMHRNRGAGVFAIERTDTHQIISSRSVGEDYEVIQHTSGGALMDQLVGAVNGAHYATAGALGQGNVVWGQIDLGMVSEVVPGDTSKQYLTFITSHDGTLAYQIRLASERAVCHNTVQIMLSEKLSQSLKVRHTKSAPGRLETISDTIAELHKENMSLTDMLRSLATRRVTKDAVEPIFDILFPKRAGKGGGDTSTRRNNILETILARYEWNDGDAFPQIRGTAYNLLNAITEYTDHFAGTRGESSREESAAFGLGDKRKSLALQTIVKYAAYMPEVNSKLVIAAPAAPVATPILDSILGE